MNALVKTICTFVISSIGRKIIVDADLAFELAGRKTGGRKVRSRNIL